MTVQEFQADAVKANFDRVTNKANGLEALHALPKHRKRLKWSIPTRCASRSEPFSSFINQLAHPAGVMICRQRSPIRPISGSLSNPAAPVPTPRQIQSERRHARREEPELLAGRVPGNSMPLTGSRSLRTAPALRCFLRAKHSLLSALPAEQVQAGSGKDQVRLDITPPSFFAMLK